ncbi:hypothetical protein ACGFIU_16945 [Rhodococcus oryzae]|uniref:hypothetical protein n=1 Tax=Rhodococcus oryzae TaxID=2571143 RepID=UPI003724726F
MGSNARGLAGWQEARTTQSDQWWTYAVGCARGLRAGAPPPTMTVHGLVMGRGEQPIVQGDVQYSRFWAADGTYNRTSTFALGHPAFVLSTLAVGAMVNGSRKRAARRDATMAWRETQQSSFLVTNRGILCHTTAKGWLRFDFAMVSEFHPDLPNWSVSLGFQEAAPLRLSGPAAPALALWCGHGILGNQWSADPRLAPLLA